MNSIVIIILLIIAVILSGCTTEIRVVEKTSYVYIPIGETLVSPIIPPRPPDKETYISSSFEKRTGILASYIADLLKVTRDLNNRLIEIHNLDLVNKDSIEDFNRKEEERVQAILDNTVKDIKRDR